MDLLTLFTTFGPWGIICFFVWNQHKKDEKLNREIKDVRDRIEGKLFDTIEKTSKIIEQNTNALKELEKRPCLVTEDEHKKGG